MLEPDDKDVILNNDYFLLRGCSLKLTKYVLGIVVYTGPKTKIMNNSPVSRLKMSRVEEIMHFQIITIFLFQLFLALIGTFSYIYLKNSKIVIYLILYFHIKIIISFSSSYNLKIPIKLKVAFSKIFQDFIIYILQYFLKK